MRQFILATGVATSGTLDGDNSSNYGKVGIGYLNKSNNKLTLTNDPSKLIEQGEGFIVLLRDPQKGGNVVLPFHTNHFSFVGGTYQGASAFEASVTIPAPDSEYYDYTLIVTKKGKGFNERANWTASVRVKHGDTAATLATKLKDYFDKNVDNLGLTVAISGNDSNVLTFTAVEAGVDYTITPADDLTGLEVTYTTHGLPAYGDAKYIIDLANKAAADAGFEYTYEDTPHLLYPNYPLNPLAQPDGEDSGFDIVTIRCAEPRDVKTRDEVVHQIIQIALPTPNSINLVKILSKITAGETGISNFNQVIPAGS